MFFKCVLIFVLFFRVSSCSISVPVSSLVLWVFTAGDLYLFSKLLLVGLQCSSMFVGVSSDVIIYSNECKLFITVLFLGLLASSFYCSISVVWGGVGGKEREEKIY